MYGMVSYLPCSLSKNPRKRTPSEEPPVSFDLLWLYIPSGKPLSGNPSSRSRLYIFCKHELQACSSFGEKSQGSLQESRHREGACRPAQRWRCHGKKEMCVIKAYHVHCEILPFLACVGLAAQRAAYIVQAQPAQGRSSPRPPCCIGRSHQVVGQSCVYMYIFMILYIMHVFIFKHIGTCVYIVRDYIHTQLSTFRWSFAEFTVRHDHYQQALVPQVV